MSDGGSALESSIEDLVELEAELSTDAGAAVGTDSEGTLAGAEKVPAGDVPTDYPVTIDTGHALRLAVATDDAAVETYLAWPEPGSDAGHVELLLDALGRGPDEFADLYGDEVALASAAGWHVLDLRRTAAARGADRSDGALRRSGRAVVGAVALGAVAMVLWAADAVGTAGSLLLFLSWLAIPATVYTDLKNVTEQVPWDTDGWPWLVGCLVPLFGVPIGTAYLMERGVRVGGVAPGETVDRWLWVAVGALALRPLSLVVALVAPMLFGVLFLHALVLLPVSVYFDAGYVGDATGWDLDEEAWASATALCTSFGFGWAVAVYYLVKRRGATDGGDDGEPDSDRSTAGRDLALLDGEAGDEDGEVDDEDGEAGDEDGEADGEDDEEADGEDDEEADGEDDEEADGEDDEEADSEDGWGTAEGWGDDEDGWGTAEGWGDEGSADSEADDGDEDGWGAT